MPQVCLDYFKPNESLTFTFYEKKSILENYKKSDSKPEKRNVQIKFDEDLRIDGYVIVAFVLLKNFKGKADIGPHLNL